MSQERRLLGGRYRVEGSIGRGGMAQVYQGTDTVLNRTVAIKVLGPQYASDDGFVQRFRREAQAAARLNHPNVVSVYDTGSDGPVHYIVMEYVPGRTLAEVLKTEGHLLPERAAEVTAQVAGALSFAHAAGIVHRDVKPANIMITPQGEVKVMDFGIARAVSTETITQTATVLGTASYLSPEQAQGDPVDARSDIYSLGVVAYEMLTGSPPFTADSPVAVAYKHVREAPARPTEVVPGIPPDLEAIVLKAMAKNPANRYASASEMREDLERFLAGRPVLATPVLAGDETMVFGGGTHEGTAVMTTPVPPDMEEGRRRWWVWLLVGLLVAGLLALALFLLAQSLIGSEPTVKVPPVIGLSEDAARIRLETAGLKVGNPRFKPSPKPEGKVLDQNPSAGTEVKSGATVTLVISAGQRQVAVPDITGLTTSRAQALLGNQHLTLGQQLAANASDTVAANHIITQQPAAGDQVPAGTAVNYVISTGPQTVSVPDVVCQPVSDAMATLQQRGLDPQDGGTDPNGPNFNCPDPDAVSRTDPPAGTDLDPGSQVTVFHSSAPPTPTTTAPSSPAPTTTLPTSPAPTT